MGLFAKIKQGLKKTKDALINKLNAVFRGGDIDADFYDDLEFALINSDMGATTSQEIIARLKDVVREKHIFKQEKAREELKDILKDILSDCPTQEYEYPLIITVVGVNGVGKTTTIGKLANYFKQKKKSVTLVAGDTFRAAATEQLTEWAKRVDVKIVKHQEGADASAVVYDGIASAKAKKTDVLIVDTAGRLHTKVNLMEELKKINRIEKREWPEAMQLNLIVVDATIGQNSLVQVNAFKDAIGIDGIVLTKLDGTSRGGIIFPILKEIKTPVYFVGVGEGVDDLEEFDANSFVDGIL
ncbi:MAG: signal recognition particle-docking protein FtsY [Clostridia bacterium]|nr:signal recognition particle-docking protein FtsY [Clostridia bacterium]